MSTIDAALPAAPQLEGPAPHLLIVRAPYYTKIVDGLRDGAERMLREADNIKRVGEEYAGGEKGGQDGTPRMSSPIPHRSTR